MIQSDRAGLVAFAGKAILQCPLTLDHAAFNLFLNVLEPDYLPVGGTDLAGAIETALAGFEQGVDSERAIILITDGEITTGDAFEMAKRAATQGVKIFCMGVGSPEGAPVPDSDGGFKKDESGKIVISRVDETGLEKLATMTGGVYVRSVPEDMDIDRIYNREIQGGMEKKTLKSGRQKVWHNRFQWLLLPGIILIMIEMMLDYNRRGIFFSVLLVLPLLTLNPGVCEAHASASVKKGIEAYGSGDYEGAEKHFIDAQLDRPDLDELYYNIGSAAYKKGDFDAAVKNFTRARQSDDPALKPKAIYNLGNALYRLGDLKGSLEAYEELVDLTPEDKEAMENLEFVKKKLEEQEKQEKQNQDNQGQKEQDQKKKDQENQDQDNQSKDNQSKEERQNNDSKDEEGENMNQANRAPQPQERHNENQEQKDQQNNGQENNDRESDPREARGQTNNDEAPGKNGKGFHDPVLNRLKDKPGRAMMPAYGKGTVTKDW
jgi:Ca-activated chloride channel family protein